MEIEHPNSPTPSGRKRRKRVSNPGLLGELIETRFFQILIGKASPFGTAPASLRKSRKSNNKQSFTSMAVDLVIFMILVILAPPFTLCRFVANTLGQYWWIKFTLGMVTGVAALVACFVLVQWLY